MFKFTVAIFAVIACAAAKPGLVATFAYSAPLVAAAPGVVTATSSQVVARNYNGIATAPIFAAGAPVAKYVAAPFTAPVAAPLAAAPVVAAPLAAKYVASPFASPLAYSAPLAAAPFGYGAYGYASPLSYASAPLVL